MIFHIIFHVELNGMIKIIKIIKLQPQNPLARQNHFQQNYQNRILLNNLVQYHHKSSFNHKYMIKP